MLIYNDLKTKLSIKKGNYFYCLSASNKRGTAHVSNGFGIEMGS